MCRDCDLTLVEAVRLGPSLEQSDAESASWEGGSRTERALPWRERTRAIAVLAALSIATLGVFAGCPWIEILSPYEETRTGWDLARGRLGWLWGGAIAQVVLLPLLWSRTSLAQLYGVRGICVLFASLPLVEVLFLIAKSPKSSGPVPFEYLWSWGAYLSMILSVAAMVAAARLGAPAWRAESRDPASGRRHDLH